MASPRTLLGPLTTAWTPPSICTYAMAGCNTCTTLWQGQSCNPERRAHDWTDCWPPRASGVLDPGVMMGWGFYSPAFSCPNGYATAALATTAGSSGWGVRYSMTSGETAIACCLSGYSISSVVAAGTTGQTCVFIATRTTSLSTVQCISGSFVNFAFVTVPNTDAPGPYTIFAPLFQLNYRAQDRASPANPAGPQPAPSSAPRSVTNSSGPSAPGSFPGSGQPAETSPPLPPPPPPPQGGSGESTIRGGGGGSAGGGGGLTVGAKVGIGIGVVMAVVVLLLLLLARMLRRRRAARPVGERLPDEAKAMPREPELGGTEVRELEANEKPRELASDAPGSSSRNGDYGGGGDDAGGASGPAAYDSSRAGAVPANAGRAGIGPADAAKVFELEGSHPAKSAGAPT